MDRAWWDRYATQVKKEFTGSIWTAANRCHDARLSPARHYDNSGAGAIALAARLGAQKIILLGYDCQHTGGKTHWHGDHPAGLKNAGAVDQWAAHFAAVARDHRCVKIVNCTRSTRLTCWQKAPLEDVLND